MSTIDRSGAGAVQLDPLPVYLDARAAFADRFLFGAGLEIGPLHQPLAVPGHVKVRYVDRMTTPELRKEYHELADWDLVDVAVVDDGEKLATIAAESQDFIVANHFLEHTEDPVGTIETHLGKLKPGGILFYAVPDKRFTFDYKRPLTPLDHMVADHEEGPQRSRPEHYREWCRWVMNEEGSGSPDVAAPEEWVERRGREIDEINYSIHMHVWTQAEFLQLILAIRERCDEGFDIEAAGRSGIEFLVVLRKQGPLPPPSPGSPPLAGPSRLDAWVGRARSLAVRARNEVRRRRARP